MANFSFNARTVEPDQGRVGAMPAGWYPVIVDESEIKPTGNGDGSYLNFRFSVLDGAHKNSKCWHRFNTVNQSAKAVEIAYKQLSALMHAVNVLDMTATEQLHNRPLFVKLKLVQAELDAQGNVKYEAKNEITAFRDINDQAAKAGFQSTLAGVSAAPKVVAPPPVQTAPAAAAQPGSWQQPATQQPWQQQAAQQPVQQPVQQQVQQAAQPPAQAPAWNPNGQPAQNAGTVATADGSIQNQTSAPASVAQVQQPWNQSAAQTAAPVQQTTIAPAQASTAAQPSGEILPPWMQGGQQ